MKKIVLGLLFVSYVSPLYAQRDSLWSNGGFFQFNFNQVALSNWAGGGENSISGTMLLNYYLNYRNRDSTVRWENIVDMGYGLTRLSESGIRKNEDRIDFHTRYSLKATKRLNYSVVLSFRSQFAPGYKYPNDSIVISQFMAPGYVTLSLGLDYKPNNYLSVFASPATGKITVVGNQNLADQGAFGVRPALRDAAGNIVRAGNNVRSEVGAYLEARLKKGIMKNIQLQSRLTLFNNYTDQRRISNRKNVDINSETALNMKVNEFIAASLFIQFIYDDDINISVYEDVDGAETLVSTGPRLQFKQTLGIGFSYRFDRK